MANENRLIDATADCFEEVTKIKTHFAKIIVEDTAEKPYYSILYYDPTKKEYFNGYGSYYIANVFGWLSEWFEIVEATTVDVVEVVRCKDCKHWQDIGKGCTDHVRCCEIGFYMIGENGYCYFGERREGE